MNSYKDRSLENPLFKCLTKNCDSYGHPESKNYCSACFRNLSKDKSDVTCDENRDSTSNLHKQYFEPMPQTFERMQQEAKQLGFKYGYTGPLNPRQKLISYMYFSDKANRCPFKTTCMIFGQSGVGKSSFINHLIGRDLLKTNPFISETREIQEVVLTMKEPSLNVSNLQLIFVDTPGFFDDDGDNQDKKNYNALKEYRKKNFEDYYPNLIFIVIQGTDTRFLKGPLKKFLTKLKKLDIVCPTYCNVICLFTHATYFLNDLKKNIEGKIKRLIDLCFDMLEVTVSVAYIDNNYTNLKKQGDWTVLSDGTLQPLNVFNCAKMLMEGNDNKPVGQEYIDPLGYQTLASFFKASSSEYTIKTNEICKNAEISDDSMSQSYSGDAEILGEIFVGKGYDVFYDKIKETSIFELEESEKNQEENNQQFNIKKGFDITCDKSKTSYFLGPDSELFTTQRLNAIGLGDKVDPNFLLSKKNILNGSFIKSNWSYFYEISTHKLCIPDASKLKLSNSFVEAVVTPDFPTRFVANDSNVTEFFRNFFERWGFYIVMSANLGGSVELRKIHSNQIDKEAIKDQLKYGLKILKDGFQKSQDCGDIFDFNLSLTDIELNWIGGVCEPQISHLKNIQTIGSSSPFKSWKASLTFKPSVLKTKLKLQSIADFVSRINKKKGETCQTALEHMLGISKRKQSSIKRNTSSIAVTPDTRISAANDAEPDNNSCFSGNGKVIVMKSYPVTKLIKDINVGDKVLSFETKTKKFIYSTVYMLAHKNDTKKTIFLKISCKNGSFVTLSSKHLVYTDCYKVKHADQIKIGDKIWTTSIDDSEKMNLCKVDSIKITKSVGFYAPLTMSGNIIVDGVLSSCYANVKDVSLPGFGRISGQVIAHFGTAPLRVACLVFRKKFQTNEEMPKYIIALNQLGKRANLVAKP
ncbi:uncharacterized protein LOC100206774 isoform X1 [Hydra vulgaris]|uniref:uncharacterized protein LOC100206774 isoform X1 n=2 Tax=Hydra vulgaris TaxID=6087 RepID=UPI001F5EFD46|nr:uncharacterized protein LOC100206774 isoform X1 [Hydra vulgaris]